MTLINPKAGLREARAEKARRHLSEFVKQSWHLVDPGSPLRWGWHADAICDHLEAVSRGWIRHLLINIPPGHGKSLFTSVFWPAWEWTWNPTVQNIFASYAQELAERDSIRCRDLIMQPWYQNNFVERRYSVGDVETYYAPGVQAWDFNAAQNRVSSFKNTMSGARQCLSVGSKATGFRGNKITVDDPLNVKEAHSEVTRKEAIYWWSKVMPTRINDPAKGAFVIMMQRIHEEDLSGFVLEGGKYEHLCLPTEYEADRRCVTYIRKPGGMKEKFFEDPRAERPRVDLVCECGCPACAPDRGEEPVDVPCACVDDCARCRPAREAGAAAAEIPVPPHCACDLLFPQLFTRAVVEGLKKPVDGLGEDGFAGQHQQHPTSAEGGMFKKHWWRFWRPDGVGATWNAPRPKGCVSAETHPAVVMPKVHQVICSIDATFKETERSDFVVATVWGIRFAEWYLIDRIREKMDFERTLKALVGCEKGLRRKCPGCATCVRSLRVRYPQIRKWLIEDKANGSAIITSLKTRLSGVIEINPGKDNKESRASAMQPYVEAGQVFLPDGAPWLEEWVGEFGAFPKGKHDDQVDSSSQAIIHLGANPDAARLRALSEMG